MSRSPLYTVLCKGDAKKLKKLLQEDVDALVDFWIDYKEPALIVAISMGCDQNT